MGFIPKWIFIKEIRILNLNFLILFILLISSINIYIYLRIFISILLKKKLLKTKKNQLNLLQKFILVTNILPFILFI
jgi:NADH:ubiquinone oxidoreductase subunit 2 (subunit N)